MSGPVIHVRGAAQPLPLAEGAPGGADPNRTDSSSLPKPSVHADKACMDVMAMLYALTENQRDAAGQERRTSIERKNHERQDAVEHQKEQIRQAQEAKDDGGWLSDVTKALGSAADAIVGGSPLDDIAHDLSDATGCEVFNIAYDFIRPDALLHAAVMLSGAATGSKGISQVYDAKPWAAPQGPSGGEGGASLKTRSQGAADATGHQEVMDAYAVTRDAEAAAMVTVATCGTGTVAMVAVASSAALMLEEKADLLGKAGVDGKTKMWVRLGAQAVLIFVNAGASFGSATSAISGGGKAAVQCASGANQMARGSVKVGEAAYQHASDEHLANASKYDGVQHRIDREQQRIVSGLRDVMQSYQRTLQTLTGTITERDQTRLTMAHQIA